MKKLLSLLVIVVASLVQPAHAAAPRDTNVTFRSYVPVMARGPEVNPITIFSSTNCADRPGNAATSSATLPVGTRFINFATTVKGASGKPYRMEWSIDGKRITGLDESGTVASASDLINTGVIYGPVGTFSCQDALPAGVYQVAVFVAGVRYQTATATIKASLAATNATSESPATQAIEADFQPMH